MKVGFIGSAGTGKSAMVHEISLRTGLEPLYSRHITREMINNGGYYYSSDNYIELFLAEPVRQNILVDRRIESEMKWSEFITDRTTVDNFAYALLRVEKYSDAELKSLETRCRENVNRYTHLFYIQRNDGNLKDNKCRTTNRWFQMKIDFMLKGIIFEWGLPCVSVKAGDWESVLKHLK